MPAPDSCVSNVFRDLNFSDTVVSTTVRSYALGITGTPVLSCAQDSVYAGFTVYGTAGVPPYSFSVVGSLPTGLSLTTDEVSGTPTVAGSYTGISIRVTDFYGVTADLPTFTITITGPGSAFGLLLALTQ